MNQTSERYSLRAASRRSVRTLHSLALLAAVAGAFISAGCARRFPGEQIPRMQWLILPFEQPPAQTETPREIRGWWFGATTIRQNNRAGAMFADSASAAMAKMDWVNLFSTIDLKYYYADKEQMLKTAYPYLEREEIKKLVAQVPPLDFARELKADKLLTGSIISQYLSENRTIHTWKAVIDVEIRVVDVKSGKVEWSHRYSETGRFDSEKTVQEEITQEMADDLMKEYFKPMIKK